MPLTFVPGEEWMRIRARAIGITGPSNMADPVMMGKAAIAVSVGRDFR